VSIMKWKYLLLVIAVFVTVVFYLINIGPSIVKESEIKGIGWGTLLPPSPNGEFIITYEHDNEEGDLLVYELATMDIIGEFHVSSHAARPNIYWNKTSTKFIVTYSEHKLAHVFDVSTKKFKKLPVSDFGLFVSPNEEKVAVLKDNIIHLINMDSLKVYKVINLAEDTIVESVLSWSEENEPRFIKVYLTEEKINDIAKINTDGSIKLFNTAHLSDSIYSTPVTKEGVLFKGPDNKTYLLNFSTEKIEKVFNHSIGRIAWNPGGTHLHANGDIYTTADWGFTYSTKSGNPLEKSGLIERSSSFFAWIDDNRMVKVIRQLRMSGFLGATYYIEVHDVVNGEKETKKIEDFRDVYLAKEAKKLLIHFKDRSIGVYSFQE
jgi:hypothetical protein